MAEADLKKASGITGTIDTNVTDRCTRLLGQICFAGSAIDPRAIRALNALTDSVDVSDRCARSLGTLCFGGIPIDPRDRNWDLNFATDQVDASGSSVTATIAGTPSVDVTDRAGRLLGIVNSITNPVDISDRAARLVGIVYGNLTQLQQRAVTNELLVQLRNAGVDIDPRDRNWDLNFASDQVDASGSTVTTTTGSLVTVEDAYMTLRLLTSYLSDLAMTIDQSTLRSRVSVEAGSLTSVGTVTTLTSLTNIVNIGNREATLFQNDLMDINWATSIRPWIV